MKMISRECRVQSDSPKANNEGTDCKPTAGFTTLILPPSGRKLYQNVAVCRCNLDYRKKPYAYFVAL